MNRLRASLCVALLVTVGLSVRPTHSAAPAPTTTLPTTTTSSTTTSSTIAVMSDASCPMWWQLAAVAGFTADELITLDRIMFRESRCDPTQLNSTDPNGGSVGLTQINRFWCLPSRYYPDGYLQTVGVLNECDDLYTPAINLRAARALADYSISIGVSAWHQWAWL